MLKNGTFKLIGIHSVNGSDLAFRCVLSKRLPFGFAGGERPRPLSAPIGQPSLTQKTVVVVDCYISPGQKIT
jgi:hypothetical protein